MVRDSDQQLGRQSTDETHNGLSTARDGLGVRKLIERSRMRLEALAAIGDVLSDRASKLDQHTGGWETTAAEELDVAINAWLEEWRRRLSEVEDLHRAMGATAFSSAHLSAHLRKEGAVAPLAECQRGLSFCRMHDCPPFASKAGPRVSAP